MESLNTWDAIAQMRSLTSGGYSFSISFEGYTKSKRKATGAHTIRRCVLRSAPPVSKDQYAEYKLFLFDLETSENRVCWQPLITRFNDQKVELR